MVGVKAPIECWPIALERARYVGEPVAVVVARDRYVAEDALDLIAVSYRALPAVVDPRAALAAEAPVLHAGLGGNLASERSFRYGDPEGAFAAAPHRMAIEVNYPRNACTPIETYGVIADYDPALDAYDVTGQFPGPVQHPCGDRARAQGAGQSFAPAHAARIRAAASGSSRASSPISC